MNYQFSRSLLALITLITFVGCAHHRDVRPNASGEHKVVLNVESKDEGYQEAISQAEHYCESKEKSPVVVKEGVKYTGTMKEDSYNTGKKVSKAAQMAGGAVWAMGGRNESNAGGVVGLGGGIVDETLGKGYTYEMIFRCQ